MDAVILAGGAGSRLRPVTLEMPKALIPIRGRPLTDHVVDVLRRAGARSLHLSLGYFHEPVARRYCPQFEGLPCDWVLDNHNGTAAWIPLFHRKGVAFTDPFIVVNGDNLCNVDFRKALETHRAAGAEITIVLTRVADPSAYGVADIEAGGTRIRRFVEKPRPGEAPSDLINTGYYIFSAAVLPDLLTLFPQGDLGSSLVMLEHDVFPRVAARGRLHGHVSNEDWFDTGTFDRWSTVIDRWKLA
ncbi:MAG: nucleotidyltransferase family protein [Planctomycetota bacterium]